MNHPTKGKEFSVTDILPFVEAPGAEKPLELQQLDISVTVTGLLARMSQTMRFFNPNHRDLEGTLTFPLPDNATVVGYALDVDNQMVDGVPVSKQQARMILEAEERKGIDPGIVEQVRGNVYRTRIYPLPAGLSRLVRIDTITPLLMEGNDAAFHLPLSHAEHIEDVRLTVEVVQSPVTPTISSGIGNLSLASWEDRGVAEAHLGKGVSSEDLLVKLPQLPDLITMVEETPQGETFFCVSRRLPHQAAGKETLPVKRIALAWDASGSRRNIEKDLDFVRHIAGAYPDMTVDVTVFRNRGFEDARTFDLGQDKPEALVSFLKAQPLDGATDLSALDLNQCPNENASFWLLFSDGMRSAGNGLPACGDRRVVTVNSQADADLPLLKYLAVQTGGLHINLLTTPADTALKRLKNLSSARPRIRVENAENLHEISRWGRFNIVGRMQGEAASCRLEATTQDADVVSIKKSAAAGGDTIARFWAGLEARKLALTADDGSDEVTALGQRYGVVTPGTSLLVLESLEQYLEYGIEPPETRPQMRQQYREHRVNAKQEKKQEEKDHLDRVFRLWRNRLEWYEKGNPPQPPPVGSGRRPMAGGDTGVADFPQAMEAPGVAEMNETSLDDMAALAEPMPAKKMPDGRPSVKVQPWNPKVPYLEALNAAGDDEAYAAYLQQRPAYAGSPAFFLDCGDHLIKRGLIDAGLRVLSNLLEMGLDDPTLMRMYSWRLQQAGKLDLAVQVFERVRNLRNDEPQSHRDLALALCDRWQDSGKEADAVRSMDLLWEVIRHPWERFPEIEVIALMELNRLIRLAKAGGIDIPEIIEDRFIRLVDVDLRISMSWDADLTDIDLHVFEPDGGHAYYSHNRTRIGGLVSRDFTQGYGPEEYILKKAMAGVYKIKAHYYGSSQQSICGACTVVVNLFTDFGRDNEQKQVLTLRLDKTGDEIMVGEIEITGDSSSEPPVETGDWRKKFGALKKGMTVDEIVAAVGQPVEVKGSREMVMIYKPENGVVIHVTVGPNLVSVRQHMDGAVRDLI